MGGVYPCWNLGVYPTIHRPGRLYFKQNADVQMKKELSILCVEDVPADIIRLNHALREGGMSFCSKRVDTQEAFVHELEHNPPDVILSDHGLPAFEGFMALTIAREKCPEVPFIFVTGKLGEQIAIETLKNGATDYVLKSNLTKLAPTIQRALREAEERAAKQQALQFGGSENFYRQLVECSPDAVIVIDNDDGLAFANPAAVKLLGAKDAAELAGKRAAEIFHSDPPDPAVDQAREQRNEQPFAPFVEQRISRLDGTVCDVEVSATPVAFQGRPAMVFTVHDISPGKGAQAAEELRRSEELKTTILKMVPDATLLIDHEGKIQEWNRAAQRIFGYSREQVMGRFVDDLIIPAPLLEVYRDGVANFLINGVGSLLNRPIELTLRRADGSEFQAELAITRVGTAAEEPQACTVLIHDITGRKQQGGTGVA